MRDNTNTADGRPGGLSIPDAEELGICVGCNKPIRIGEVVTPYDDEIGHANCDDPFSWDVAHLTDVEGCPEPVLLLGSPAIYIKLTTVKIAVEMQRSAADEWSRLCDDLRREAEIREAGRWSSQ